MKLPEATGKAIRAELDSYIGGLVKAGESPSIIPHHGQRHLLEITRKAGCNLSTEALLAACAIPGHLIRSARDLRKVHRFNTDRKAREDSRPRISRTRAGLLALLFRGVFLNDDVRAGDDAGAAADIIDDVLKGMAARLDANAEQARVARDHIMREGAR